MSMNQKRMKMDKGDWDHEKDELLIELVKTKTELYDISSALYSDNIKKRNAWNEIGGKLNKTGTQCKDRWEQLRAQHRRHIHKNKTKSSQASSTIAKWKYDEQMSFLKQFMKERVRMVSLDVEEEDVMHSEIDDNGCQVASDEDEGEREEEMRFSEGEGHREAGVGRETDTRVRRFVTRSKKPLPIPVSQPPLKETASAALLKFLLEKKKEEERREDVTPHHIDQFFALMATTVKQFNAVDQHYIKNKVFSLVSEFEGKYLY